jgi:hypothetical protein
MLEDIGNNILNLVVVKHHLEESTKRLRSLSHQIFNFISQLHLKSSLDFVRLKAVAHQILDVVLVVGFFESNFELIKIRAVSEVLILPFDNE